MRTRNKNCYICKKDQKVLYRCKFDDSLSWYFLCKTCMDSVKKKYSHNYKYGGTWKSKKNH